MKQNRIVKEFLNEVVKFLESKASGLDHFNHRANIDRIAAELKTLAERQDPQWEKEIDDTIMPMIWVCLRFYVNERNVINTDHKAYAWVIYELIRDC